MASAELDDARAVVAFEFEGARCRPRTCRVASVVLRLRSGRRCGVCSRARIRVIRSSDSTARAVASTRSWAWGVAASAPPVTSITPITRRVSGSRTGAAVHDQGATFRLKCSEPWIWTERPSAMAVPGAEVPTAASGPVGSWDEAHVVRPVSDVPVPRPTAAGPPRRRPRR